MEIKKFFRFILCFVILLCLPNVGFSYTKTTEIVIDPPGKLAIGHTDPNAQLDIEISSAVTTGLRIQAAAAQSVPYVDIDDSNDIQKFKLDYDGTVYFGDANNPTNIYSYGNIYSGVLSLGNNPGVIDIIDCTVDPNSSDGTEHGVTISVDSSEVLRVTKLSDGAGSTDTPTVEVSASMVVTGSFNYVADSAADDDYIVTLDPAPAAYVSGLNIYFDANTANTGACTLNVNSLGAKSIKKLHDQDPGNNCIEAGSIVHVIYDGINFQLMCPCAN